MMNQRIGNIRIYHRLITRDSTRVNLEGFGGWE
jgi:hypothetical protein